MLRFQLSWKDVVKRLNEIREDDEAFVDDINILTDNEETRAVVIVLYVRYTIASNELSICHDNNTQPQIRTLIKKMLMCVYGRILELKTILIDVDSSIYTSIITELNDLKLTYDYFELRIPQSFRDERRSFLSDMDNQIDAIHKRVIVESNSSSQIEEEFDEKEEQRSNNNELTSQGTKDTEFDLMNLIPDDQQMPQKFRAITNEEILRGLAITSILKYLTKRNNIEIIKEELSAQITRKNIISGKYQVPTKEVSHEAAVKIQLFWRFYRIMRRTRVRTERKNILIGLIMPSSVRRPNTNIINEYYDLIKTQQNEVEEKLKKVTTKLQEKFNRRTKQKVIEEIDYDLRSHIWTNFERLPFWPDSTPIMFTNNDILDLPPIVLSKVVLNSDDKLSTQLESALNSRIPLGGTVSFDTGSLTIEFTELIATLVVEFENKTEKEQDDIIEEFIVNKQIENENENNIISLTQKGEKLNVVPKLSEFTGWFDESFKEFDNYWTNDYGPDNEPREDLVKTAIVTKFQSELKVTIDQIIQGELDRIKIKLATELGDKKKKKKKSKKSKKKKKNKKTSNNIPNYEQILEELVKNNMVKKSVISEFKEFEGEILTFPRELDNPYSLGDLRHIIKEQIMLGLIFPELRASSRIKLMLSLLIAGPIQSGKTLLINALCTETGSLKIELTPQNVSDNYTEINEINQLIVKIVEFAKVNQPVVIEVDLADVPFYKKIPENLKKDNPVLMGKVLSKLLKSFKKTDRVIVIGKATKPWLTKGKQLTLVFPNIVFTVPDDNSMFLFLSGLLMRYTEVSRRFLIRPLLEMLSNYPRQMITEIVAEIMTYDRLARLKHVPLDHKEFIPAVMKYPSPYLKLQDQYHDWYNKYVPMGIKNRLEKVTPEEEPMKMDTDTDSDSDTDTDTDMDMYFFPDIEDTDIEDTDIEDTDMDLDKIVQMNYF